MAAKIGGGQAVNLPVLLRTLADAIDGAAGTVFHIQELPTGQWRDLSFTYMIRETDNADRPQDIFIDHMSDTTTSFPEEDVVESEGQESGQETP